MSKYRISPLLFALNHTWFIDVQLYRLTPWYRKKILYTLSAASSPNRRISLIQIANTEELLALVEIALNELRSRIPVRAQQKERLMSQATSIWHLSRTCNSNSVRKIY